MMLLVRKWRRHIGFVWKANEGSIPSSRTKYLQVSNLRMKNLGNSPELQRKVTTKSPKEYRACSSIPFFAARAQRR